jgi:hypothetical protein
VDSYPLQRKKNPQRFKKMKFFYCGNRGLPRCRAKSRRLSTLFAASANRRFQFFLLLFGVKLSLSARGSRLLTNNLQESEGVIPKLSRHKGNAVVTLLNLGLGVIQPGPLCATPACRFEFYKRRPTFHRRAQRSCFLSSRCASAIQIVRPLTVERRISNIGVRDLTQGHERASLEIQSTK